MMVDLEKVSLVKEFVKVAQDIASEVHLKSGKFVVDAKSILGIFSLDLSKPIELVCDEVYLSKFEKFKA